MKSLSIPQLLSALTLALITFFLASYLSAWSGPTQAPPSGNVAAPINVGTTNQVKNGSVGFNGLAVFGNTLFSGSNRYANFGSTAGESGYGLRDSSGTIQYKNSGGSWQPLGSGGGEGGGGGAVLHVRHQLPAGTTPGAGTANTWYTRPLNTVAVNEISGASLSANRISLPAGTYEISAHVSSGCATYASYVDQVRFRNVTDNTTAVVGLMGFLARGTTATGDAGGNASSIPFGRFTISGTKNFELQQYATYAMYSGCASASGEVGIYADVIIRKL